VACIALAAAVAIAVLAAGASLANAQGGELAYIASDFRSVRVVQADGSGDRQLLSAAGSIGDIAWSTDGKLLAYTLQSSNQRFAAQRLFVFDASSGQTRELHSSQGTYGPIAFFPDGKRLAAVSNKSDGLHCGGPALAIDVSTGTASTLSQVGCFMTRLQVTPDGADLIATSHGGDPSSTITDTPLGSAGQPTFETDPGVALAFSGEVTPDGGTLVYIGLPMDRFPDPRDLVVANRDGSNPQTIWQGPLRILAISPDGTQLAAIVESNSNATTFPPDEQVWVLGIDGGDPHQVASGHAAAWRFGSAQVPARSAPAAAQQTGATVTCPNGRLVNQGEIAILCSDGTGYFLDPDPDNPASTIVSAYDPSHPESGVTGGPWLMSADSGPGAGKWVDSDRRRTCQFDGATAVCQPTASEVSPSPATSASAQPNPPAASVITGAQTCVTPRLSDASVTASGVSTIGNLDDATIAAQVQSHGGRWAVIYSDDAVGVKTFGLARAALQRGGVPQPLVVPIPLGEANLLPYVSKIPRDGSIQAVLLASRTTISTNDLERVMSLLLQFKFNERMAIVVCAA
jgi:hypothetical protein